MMNNRKNAMHWWNNLGNKQKDDYTSVTFPNRNYVTLTGREIEIIWNTQNNK